MWESLRAFRSPWRVFAFAFFLGGGGREVGGGVV